MMSFFYRNLGYFGKLEVHRRMKAFIVLLSLFVCQNAVGQNTPQVLQLKLQGDLIQYYLFYTTVSVGTPPVQFTVTVHFLITNHFK
jgi:hypothetical protein